MQYDTLSWNASITHQSNPAANDDSMAGAISFADVMMYFSARAFLGETKKKTTHDQNRFVEI